MDDRYYIRKRIKTRRAYQFQGKEKKPILFTLFYRIMMLMMVLCILVLSYVINSKTNFISIPSTIAELDLSSLRNMLPFESWFENEKEVNQVAALPEYILLKENQYSNGTNQANCIMDGIVLHVQTNENQMGSVTIQHDNGVIATYDHLDNLNLKIEERVLKGMVLGTYQEYIDIVFMKQNQKLDYETAIQP